VRGAAGFSYVEVLIAMVLVAVCLVPAMDALQTGIRGSAALGDFSSDRFGILEKMEEVLAEPFGDLESAAVAAGGATVATSYSDDAGTPGRRIVYIAPYDGDDADDDGDPFTGGDDGLLWVRVAAEASGVAVQSLTNRY